MRWVSYSLQPILQSTPQQIILTHSLQRTRSVQNTLLYTRPTVLASPHSLHQTRSLLTTRLSALALLHSHVGASVRWRGNKKEGPEEARIPLDPDISLASEERQLIYAHRIPDYVKWKNDDLVKFLRCRALPYSGKNKATMAGDCKDFVMREIMSRFDRPFTQGWSFCVSIHPFLFFANYTRLP